jgi:hypothetical protein
LNTNTGQLVATEGKNLRPPHLATDMVQQQLAMSVMDVGGEHGAVASFCHGWPLPSTMLLAYKSSWNSFISLIKLLILKVRDHNKMCSKLLYINLDARNY